MNSRRTRAGLASLVGLCFLAVAAPLLAGQKITVRFLDADSGKPFAKFPVWISLLKRASTGGLLTRDVLATVIVRTDRSGAAAVELMDPMPPFVTVGSVDLRNGPDVPSIPTAKVLSTGVVFNWAPKGKKPRFHPTAKPGEIIIVGKRWTRWSRFLMEIP